MSKELAAQADQQDQEKIYKQLEVELKKKKGSLSAVRQMMGLTFKERRNQITQIEDADPSRVVLQNSPS